MKETMRGYNQGNIQNMNRTLLLNLLRREKVCARTTLAERSGLKQATVTHIVNDFIAWGLVREIGFMTGSKGRRSIAISINNDDVAVAGIRIARKNYSVGLFNLCGEALMIKRGRISTGQSAREILDIVIEQMDKLIQNFPDKKLLALGVSIPGPYNFRKGRISLVTGVKGWSEIALKEELNVHFHIPVAVEEHANAAAMAQYWYSKDKNEPDVLVYIAVGQGVGAGIVSDGVLLKGDTGSAGEIGHTTIDIHGPRCSCGNYGCLEMYCSTIALTKRVNEVYQPEKEFDFQEVVLLIKKKEPRAMDIFYEICDYLSVGVVNVINSFNPQVVIIGDEICHIEPELMLERIKANVKERVVPQIWETTKIKMSVIEQDSMVHGAAIVAIDEIFDNPSDYFETGDAEEMKNRFYNQHFI
ncbi:MAG: ROK family protein [Lachnospiraceae bacterium]|nr:ROK family protein [Lachnospiraceae bacterium]